MEFPKYLYRPIASEGIDAVLVNSAEEEAALGAGLHATPDEAREAFAAAQAAQAKAPAKAGR